MPSLSRVKKHAWHHKLVSCPTQINSGWRLQSIWKNYKVDNRKHFKPPTGTTSIDESGSKSEKYLKIQAANFPKIPTAQPSHPHPTWRRWPPFPQGAQGLPCAWLRRWGVRWCHQSRRRRGLRWLSLEQWSWDLPREMLRETWDLTRENRDMMWIQGGSNQFYHTWR